MTREEFCDSNPTKSTFSHSLSLPCALLEQPLEEVRPRVLHGQEGVGGGRRRRGRRRDCRRLHHDLARPKPVQKFGREVEWWKSRNLVSDHFMGT